MKKCGVKTPPPKYLRELFLMKFKAGKDFQKGSLLRVNDFLKIFPQHRSSQKELS
jgi:hypothetical protein